MSKRNLIIAVIIIAIVGVGAGGLFFGLQKSNSQKETSTTPNTSNFLSNLAKNEEESVLYEDESGFSFSYPKSVEVEDQTPNDDTYYTLLKLTKGGQNLTITIKDGNTNPYKTDKSASLIGSTSLGGISSSQYEVGGRLVSVAIDQGVLYIIDGPKDGSFWEDAQNKLLTSFKFAGQATAGGSAASENTVYEEEVVE